MFRRLKPVARSLAVLASVLVIYFALPVAEEPTTRRLVAGTIALLIGLAVLARLIVGQARRYAANPDDPGVRVDLLVASVYLVIVIYAMVYLAVARSLDGQFTDLHTKIDALYFTIATLATVGYGDIHASGQLARGLVASQMIFNLVFVAAAVTVVSSMFGRKAQAKSASRKRDDTPGKQP